MKPIFVAGCGRSGTTLLATMIAGHRRVVSPPEAQFFLEGLSAARQAGTNEASVFAAFVRDSWRFGLWELPESLPRSLVATSKAPEEVMAGLVEVYAKQHGKEYADLWVDHTPMTIAYVPTMLDLYSDAKIIHIIRDPRAVIASVLPLDWGPTTARAGARWWLSWMGTCLAAEAAYPRRVVRVSYEALVRDPSTTLERLCPLVGLDFEATMIAGANARLPTYTKKQHALVGKSPDPDRIDAWRSNLSASEIDIIEGELKDVPTMLGYKPAVTTPAIAIRTPPTEFLRAGVRAARQRAQNRLRRAATRSLTVDDSFGPTTS